MTFRILGRTALLINGTVREDWGKPKERAVLGALLVHAGRWVSVDTLIQWAWPDDTTPPRNRGPTFHHYAGRIRKWLRQMPVQPTLQTGNGGYRLDVDKSLIDYYRFTELLAEARAHAKQSSPRRTADSVLEALELWRGRPLDDLAGEPARAWRLRVVQDEWLGANRILLGALLELHEFDEVLTRVGDLQTDHPDDVTLAAHRMSALHGLGRYLDEAAYYFDVRRRLHHDGDESAVEHLRRHHEDLRSRVGGTAPVVATGPAVVVPRQLRHDVPDFVGREDLLEALDAAATDRAGRRTSGVIVLDGMAGVGKTALVRHWGHRARRHFPDGDLYADLNGFGEDAVTSRAAVVDDFLIALGHPPDVELNGRARELLLARLLSGRRVLVVLDNARNAGHVEELVALLPDALVLVTSRQQLGSLSVTTGARRLRVEPMTTDDAVALLSARIGNRREVAHHDRVRLAATCGGLPLMITLLAEHVASQPAGRIAEFAGQFDRRQLILDVGEDDESVNGKTFFGWSYRSLAEPEQRLFRLLGIHPGPDISVEAACALDGRTRAETTRGLRALVSAHLLEQPEALGRYRFHDLVREFAAHCAESDEPEAERHAAIRRVTSFYLASAAHADRLVYPSRLCASELAVELAVQPVVLANSDDAKAWLHGERANLVATMRSAAAHGHHDQAWRLADAVIAFFNRHGYHEDSVAAQKLAAASARIAGDRVGEASAMMGIGRVYLVMGDHRRARRHLGDALRLVEETGHELGQAAVLNLLGKLEMQSGDPIAALELYRRSLRIAQNNDDQQGLCWTSCRMGEALRAAEQHDRALVHLTRAQLLAERSGDQSAYATTMIEIGLVHRDRGDHSAAVAHCEQALGVAEKVPDVVLTVDACLALAEIHQARGDTAAALDLARRAVGMSRHGAAARAHEVLGDAHFTGGDTAEAAAAWENAAERYDQLGNPTRATIVRMKLERAPASGVRLPRARSGSSPVVDAPVPPLVDERGDRGS